MLLDKGWKKRPCTLESVKSNPSVGESSSFQVEVHLKATVWEKLRGRTNGLSALSKLTFSFGEVLSRWSAGEVHHFAIVPDSGDYAFDAMALSQVAHPSSMILNYTPAQDRSWGEAFSEIERNLAMVIGRFQRSAISDEEQGVKGDYIGKIGVLSISWPLPLTDVDEQDSFIEQDRVREKVHSVETTWRVDQASPFFVHCHAEETEAGLRLSWRSLDPNCSQSMVTSMADVCVRLLETITGLNSFERVPDLLPEDQRMVRKQVNATSAPLREYPIHVPFFEQAAHQPDLIALVWGEGDNGQNMSYRALAEKALCVAGLLQSKGVQPGDAVAVALPRGADQVAALLGVLAAGGAYVPIRQRLPIERRKRMCRVAQVRFVITRDARGGSEWSDFSDMVVITMDDAHTATPLNEPVNVDPSAPAYILFTSGSTGEPKGVVIGHRSAYNTIYDMNQRFAVHASDRTLAVSAFDFDLSVYDLFGLLSAGGSVVLLDEDTSREAFVWLEQIRRHRVTIWNSAPALLEMLLAACGENTIGTLHTLRLALVSGDWIGLELPGRLAEQSPDCRFIALGGATEASIWSNWFEVSEVEKNWRSIPYGTPLTNQRYRIVDQLGRDCPDWVPGELWIGGRGVAHGYADQPELTAERFVCSEGERWYRTGDLGCYWPDGTIEFLGRADQQVKLHGHRIELGEIEHVLRQVPGVLHATAVIVGEKTKQLAAVVVPTAPAADGAYTANGRDGAEITLEDTRSEEGQARFVETFIARVLHLDRWRSGSDGHLHPPDDWSIATGFEPLMRLWLCWLEQRHVLAAHDDGFQEGARFREVLEDHEPKSAIEKHLFSRLQDYERILRGDLSEASLLDDEQLSPEKMSVEDEATDAGIRSMARHITDLAETSGRAVNVAILGSRSGMAAEKLLRLLEPGQVRLTLLDDAPSMITAASQRMSALPHHVRCVRLPEMGMPSELCYQFDVVLAIHSLHRYIEPSQGIATALLLVKNGGKLIALEQQRLAPISLVTSAVLDRGYVAFDTSRKQAQTPLLSGDRWGVLMRKAGFSDVLCKEMELATIAWLEGTCPSIRTMLSLEAMKEFVTEHLPDYMIPKTIEIWPWLPVGATGKVDRKAITAALDRQLETSDGELPREGLESELAHMWRQLLDVDAIYRDHSFFEIGGDSLLATRLATKIKARYGIDLSLAQMFETPTLHEIAAELEQRVSTCTTSDEMMEEGEL